MKRRVAIKIKRRRITSCCSREGAKKAFIFKNTDGTWGTTAAFNLDQNTGDSRFGNSVAISSEFAIVGATAAKKAFNSINQVMELLSVYHVIRVVINVIQENTNVYNVH